MKNRSLIVLLALVGLLALPMTARAESVIATIPVDIGPNGVAVDPGLGMVYVPNAGSGSVSVIDEATNTVVNTIPFGVDSALFAAAVDPSSHRV